MAFHHGYKRLGVEKADELRIAGLDRGAGAVILEGKGGGIVPWAPDRLAARTGGVEVYRTDSMELREGDPQLRHIDRAWASTVHAFQGRTVDTVIAAMEANHPHLTTQKTLYVVISRERDRQAGEPGTSQRNHAAFSAVPRAALWSMPLRLSPVPDLLPCRILGRPDLITREISLVQAQKLSLGDLTKPLAFLLIDMVLRPCADVGGGPLFVHTPANYRADNLVQSTPVPHPKRIGLAPATALPQRSGQRTAYRPR